MFDGWKPGATPVKVRDRQEFLDLVRKELEGVKPNADAERVARAVFGLLSRKVSPGEIEDVVTGLPEELRGLWSETSAA